MSNSVNLRTIFNTKLRDTFYQTLATQYFQGWDARVVIAIVDDALNANQYQINDYLNRNDVNLLNMNDHIMKLIQEMLLPYLNKKRIT